MKRTDVFRFRVSWDTWVCYAAGSAHTVADYLTEHGYLCSIVKLANGKLAVVAH